jgi:hypothetical protein
MFDPTAHLLHLPRKAKDRATGHYTTVYDDYLEVKWRVLMFREKYPHGVITTEEVYVDLDRGYARYKATVADGEGGSATGYGTETAADFPDFCERAETRALGRALAVLGFGTQFVGQDLTEGDHVADAPVVQANGTMVEPVPQPAGEPVNGDAPKLTVLPTEARISRDQARDLKKLAQAAFGFTAGEQQLREDLGLEEGKPLTLMRLQAHVSPERYAAVLADYQTALRQEMERDVLDHAPNGQPAATTGNGSEPASRAAVVATPATTVAEPSPDERLRWGALSRRSMTVGLSATTWEALRQGDYAAAERVIVALEGPGQP